MKASTYLSIFGWLSMVFGISFLVLTRTTVPMYGLPIEPANLVQARYFGATLATLGLFAYLVREATEPRFQRAALLACAVGAGLGLLVTVWGLVDGVLGPLGWSSVLIYGLLLLGALYSLMGKKP